MELNGTKQHLAYWALLGRILCSMNLLYPTVDFIEDSLNELSKREAFILRKRFGLTGNKRLTLKALGKLLNPQKPENTRKKVDNHIDSERVRQIESRALRKLRYKFRKKYFYEV
jgi:DNA-directed RNA polymerase sigma subunit (sigma70/sigma32)